ncbi:MAG TPA: hypothetical protein VJV79_11350 [Polyangiaceae bacterium]|nr:hypothetical protein [Polyangiaceae bacterium]
MARVECRLSRVIARALPALLGLLSAGLIGCGDQGFFPTSVDRGADFAVADIVFDPNYFYCRVEPVLFANGCGSGDPSQGDSQGGCHFSATAYRLTDYMPRVSDSCGGGIVPGSGIPEAAQHNYQTSQTRMKRDPNLAPLLQRPTQNYSHPRKIFELNSMDADAIRQWATQFSNQ